MTGVSRRTTEAHLAECGECRALVSQLARASAVGARESDAAFAATVPAPQVPCAPVLPGQVIGGKYEVEWTIGAGGMGVVVAAWHEVLRQRVAIKFPTPELRQASEPRERLIREARACARLRSEHAVRLLDVGTLDDGSPYVVMEYLSGRTLAERLREDGPLPVAEAVDTIIQVCEALEEAHLAGIVHRDLKPSNLFETQRFDGSRLVKVLDFGIAKSAALSGEALTSTRGVMGSPGYMAPEQLRSTRDVDARADIWSLGVTLHELITGELVPLGGELSRIEPPALARVVRRCLEQDPARRFQTARELVAALASYGGSVSRGIALRLSSAPARRAIQPPWAIVGVALGAVLVVSASWLAYSHGSAHAEAALTAALPVVASVPAPPVPSATAPAVVTAAPPPPPSLPSTTIPTALPPTSMPASAIAPRPRRVLPQTVATGVPEQPSVRPAGVAAPPDPDPHGLHNRK